MGRTNMRYPYPEAGGISQPQRAAGQPLPFTTEMHTGSGIEPGVSDCEVTAFPRRHCTPLPKPICSTRCREIKLCMQLWFLFHLNLFFLHSSSFFVIFPPLR